MYKWTCALEFISSPGAERFPYARLLQASTYVSQEPYSSIDIQKARDALIKFLQRNGFFEAQVQPQIQPDKTKGLVNVDFRITLNRKAKFGDVVITGTPPDETEPLKDILHSLRARMRMAAVRSGKTYSLRTLQRAVGPVLGGNQQDPARASRSNSASQATCL